MSGDDLQHKQMEAAYINPNVESAGKTLNHISEGEFSMVDRIDLVEAIAVLQNDLDTLRRKALSTLTNISLEAIEALKNGLCK